MEELLPNMIDDNGAGYRACQILNKLILPNIDEVKQISDLSKTNPNEAYQEITKRFGADAKQLDSKLHEDFGWIVYRYMKANSEQLTAIQIRSLLRDYMQLQNERPSLLHSMILNYALNFSKDHFDFSFYKFFMLWGAKNLRYDDYQEGRAEGHDIPSLTSRICKVIIESNEVFDVQEFVAQFDRQDLIIENLRQSYFWRLMNLQKKSRLEDLFNEFTNYADNYSVLGPSHWHSEILKIANRFMIDENATKFLSFITQWDGLGNFKNEDWLKETNDEGKEFPSLAENSAKKCFEIIKATEKKSIPDTTLTWLKGLYKKVMDKNLEDDWNVRNYATICVWCGQIEEAITLYKSLLLHNGEKYYLWAELANLLSSSNDLSIGLLLKAKKIEKNEDFLGDIHLSLASLWQKEGYGVIASEELDAYASHRKEKGWAFSDRYHELLTNIVSGLDASTKVDFDLYISKAEDYVYGDFDWVDFVITDKWASENIERCNLFDGNETTICIKTKSFPVLEKAKAGDIFQFKCNTIEENQQDTSSQMHRMVMGKKTIPLIARKSEKEPWSLLPIKYGVIDYVNESKRVLHIITQDSKEIFFEYNGDPLQVDSYVKFREYEDKRKEGTRICAADVEPCSSDEALQFMPSRIVVVDEVNIAKNLFHVVLGPGELSDVVRFDQTDIRPSIGDFLRISCCIKKNKDGKKRIKFLNIQTSEVGCKGLKGTVTGRLELKYRGCEEEPNFAFIKDFYVHRNLLKKYNITHNCEVVASIVLGGDDKWKVYDLDVIVR